jgi:hypothetical protein
LKQYDARCCISNIILFQRNRIRQY